MSDVGPVICYDVCRVNCVAVAGGMKICCCVPCVDDLFCCLVYLCVYLSCVLTVSHICSLICLLSMVTIRAPNSTPMVRSWTGWKRLSVNCNNKQDLPTPTSYTQYTNSNTTYIADTHCQQRALVWCWTCSTVAFVYVTCISNDDIFEEICVRHDDQRRGKKKMGMLRRMKNEANKAMFDKSSDLYLDDSSSISWCVVLCCVCCWAEEGSWKCCVAWWLVDSSSTSSAVPGAVPGTVLVVLLLKERLMCLVVVVAVFAVFVAPVYHQSVAWSVVFEDPHYSSHEKQTKIPFSRDQSTRQMTQKRFSQIWKLLSLFCMIPVSFLHGSFLL